MPHMFYGYGGWDGGIFMILWWVLIIIGIVALVRFLARESHHGVRSNARHILEERYAKGEMSREEFEQKKKDLM